MLSKDEIEARAERLKAARKEAGFRSAAAAARQFEWTVSTYNSHENRQNPIREKQAQLYATAFGVDAIWVLYGTAAPASIKSGELIPTLEIVGAAEAGCWREEHSKEEARRLSAMVSEKNYAPETQFVVEVRGDEMSGASPVPIVPPMQLRCRLVKDDVDPKSLDGRVVLIRRTREDLVEHSLRRLRLAGSRILLVSESANQDRREIVYGEVRPDSVEIEAVVTGLFLQA